MHSVNLNYSEISDSLYRFVPSAEFTVFPLKKKQQLFLPRVEGDWGVWGTNRGISATLPTCRRRFLLCVGRKGPPRSELGPEQRGGDAAGRNSPQNAGLHSGLRKPRDANTNPTVGPRPNPHLFPSFLVSEAQRLLEAESCKASATVRPACWDSRAPEKSWGSLPGASSLGN